MSTMTEPEVTLDVAREHGLSAKEYERLEEMLGRRPTWTELGITSALWSEHCSYKSSKVYLKQLPTSAPHVLHGPGENAGVVDVGHGWVAVFKMESHNHPSYIEPYQGAATGVGGILRDVFTMGARPIACMDSLRFGALDAPRMRHLVDGVVRGIGDYGNCVGIPTVAGETQFHPAYNENILVNAFALGIARRERIFTSRASGSGNPVLYAGSRTGRDGIHGATMASDSFDTESEKKLPTVQVGDPFAEKVLLEACLEALRTGAVVALQDMGAAGLTSSGFEMAAHGGMGLHIELDRVPLREEGLSAYEIMLSESQERMLLVARRGRQREVERVFRRWGLEIVRIGRLTDDGRARIEHGGETVADMPLSPLTSTAPSYKRPTRRPRDLDERQEAPEVPDPGDVAESLRLLLATPDLASKEWIWRQYDHTVRTNTVVGPGGDAAVLVLKGTPNGLALTSDVNPVYCGLDPRTGGAQAVAEAVRNLAMVGAEPLGLTDCLNFGSPENPEVAWQLSECVAGMAQACRVLGVPVISGNVSLYNETEGRSILPTPTVAVVGVIPTLGNVPSTHFGRAGDRVVILGDDRSEFGGSAYLRWLHGIEQGKPPEVDLEREGALAEFVRMLVFDGWVRTAHDVSEGGLAVTLAESCFGLGMGARIRLDAEPVSLFSETQARAVTAIPPQVLDDVLEMAEDMEVPARDVGEVGGDRLVIQCGDETLDASVEELRKSWIEGLPRALGL